MYTFTFMRMYEHIYMYI